MSGSRINVDDLQKFVDEDRMKVATESIRLIEDEVYHQELHIGRSSKSINAGITLSALRSRDIPCYPRRLSEVFDVRIRDLILSYRYICRNVTFLSVIPTRWTVFLNEYSKSLNLSDTTLRTGFAIGQKGEKHGILSGRKPRNYAASCIYASVKHNKLDDTWITQRRLAEESEVSESTIRSTYKELLDNYDP